MLGQAVHGRPRLLQHQPHMAPAPAIDLIIQHHPLRLQELLQDRIRILLRWTR